MDLSLYQTFVEKNNVPQVRKLIYDYLILGHYDVGFCWGRIDWIREIAKNLPITCTKWHQYVTPHYAQDRWGGQIDKRDYNKECAGKRVICLNFFSDLFIIERFRQKVKKAASVTFYVTTGEGGYDLRETKPEKEE